MKKIVGWWVLCLVFTGAIDTTYIYKTNAPYGTLDLKLPTCATRYYYLKENKTYSFRESSPGVRNETFTDMTSWDSSLYTQGILREKLWVFQRIGFSEETSIAAPQKMVKGIYLLIIHQGEKLIKQRVVVND